MTGGRLFNLERGLVSYAGGATRERRIATRITGEHLVCGHRASTLEIPSISEDDE